MDEKSQTRKPRHLRTIRCKDCDQTYIGQTNRRINEKKNIVTSSLTHHVSSTSHNIDFQNTKVFSNVEHPKSGIIKIEKRPYNLNTRDDTQRLPTAWKPVLFKTKPPQRLLNSPCMTGTVIRNQAENQPRATTRNEQIVYKPPADTNI
ncbi:unnamed protein product [Brassicogethes aeneus]|uniref:Uncharacterized protein n=1 Tax=Brassicogethes aeneus TaxID=1431903 RepID=A0A9P0AZP4_BRAAE|nr:unnamed protein product [Brassicogethes aeneus]